MKLKIFGMVLGSLLLLMSLPALIALPLHGTKEAATQRAAPQQTIARAKQKEAVTVSVYRSSNNKVEDVLLHDYVVGVVASEMPAEFELEALKAQSLAARTYVVKQLMHKGSIDLPQEAVVTDTPLNQVYKDKKQLKSTWGSDYDRKIKKIEAAVTATEGEILTYEGQPITASFFSTSNGHTEDSEAYWKQSLPYLKSVPSPWDEESPKYIDTVEMPAATVETDLGITLPKGDGTVGDVVSRTPGKYIGEIKIGAETFTGRQIRDKLDLRSADFSMKKKGSDVYITTRGYGHGVGLSQYGANGMAEAGKDYKEILKHYYQGVDITTIDKLGVMQKLTAKK